MEEEDYNKYVWTIAHNIICHERFFEVSLDKWQFMLVPQPKVPFADENNIPRITFVYDFLDDQKANKALKDIYQLIFGVEFQFKDSDHGRYVICYVH